MTTSAARGAADLGLAVELATGYELPVGGPSDFEAAPIEARSIDLTFGSWSLWSDAPAQFIHVALLRNNKILAVGGSQANCHYFWTKQSAWQYDLSTSTWTQLTPANNPYGSTKDAFCAGHATDPGGRFVIQGGLLGYGAQNGQGLTNSARFDPATGAWTQLTGGPTRYYPTLAYHGSTAHTYNFAGNQVSSAGWAIYKHGAFTTTWTNTGVSHQTTSTYPRVHLLPNGKFFISSPKVNSGANPRKNYYYDAVPNTLSLAGADEVPNDGNSYVYDGFQFSSVLLPLSAYQGAYGTPTALITNGLTYFTKDLGSPTPVWTATSARPADLGTVQFPVRRRHANATILPTGQILVSGGVQDTADSTAVRDPEVYGVDAGLTWLNAWFLTTPATVVRNYHTIALLLPDGRVWTTGGNDDGYGSDCDAAWYPDSQANGSPDRRERRVEIFAPWYYGRSDRPVITSCPAELWTEGAQYSIGIGGGVGTSIVKVALVRAGNVTHAFDTGQTLVWLDIVSKTSSTVTVKAPYTADAAPAGDYFLFVLRSNGTYGARIPSIGCWTKR